MFKALRWNSAWALALAAAMVGGGWAGQALADGSVLMILDGASTANRERAMELGYNVTAWTLSTTRTKTLADLQQFDAIFLSPGAPSVTYTLLEPVIQNGGLLQQYAFYGGTLALNVSSNASHTPVAPGGVGFSYVIGGHNAEQIVTADHPYVTGGDFGGSSLTEADFANWNLTDHGYLTGLPRDTTIVLSNTDGPSLVEYTVGDDGGRVVISSMNFGWASGGESRGAPLDNLLLYTLPEPGSLILLLVAAGCTLGRPRRS